MIDLIASIPTYLILLFMHSTISNGQHMLSQITLDILSVFKMLRFFKLHIFEKKVRLFT